MFRTLLITVIAIGCLGLAGFGLLAWQPAMAPVAPPAAASFDPELIAKGETEKAGWGTPMPKDTGLGTATTYGVRLRHLPIRPAAVLQALAS